MRIDRRLSGYLFAVAAVGLLAAGCAANDGGATTPTSTAPGGAVVTAAPTTPVPPPVSGAVTDHAPEPPRPATSETVAATAAAHPLDGVELQVASVTSAAITATAPGEISGPGHVVKLTLHNTGSQALDLTATTVDLHIDGRSAPVVESASTMLTGQLVPGASAEASYAFRTSGNGSSTLRVRTSASARTIVFTGVLS